MRCLLILLATVIAVPAAQVPLALDARSAWAQVQAVAKAVPTTPPLKGRLPTKTELQQFRKRQADMSIEAADMAAQFTRRFPSNRLVRDAQSLRHRLLGFAIKCGAHDQNDDIRALETQMLASSRFTENERFQLKQTAIQRETAIVQAQGGDMMATYEKAVRELAKEFPNRPETYQMLYAIAVRSSGSKAKEIARQILQGPAPVQLKESAKTILSRANQIGEPLRIKFKATNGKEIDTLKMRGKVVLLDFWATWSASSIARLDKLEKIYRDYRDQGVEILGISADHEAQALNAYVAHRKLPWPQNLDREANGRTLRKVLGADIPALWVIDKKGILRSTSADRNLNGIIETLLTEE